MRNVYDITRELTESLRETDQFKNYAALKKQIDANPQLKAMLDDFQQKSLELQPEIMAKGQNDPEVMAKISSLYSIVMSDPQASAYLQAQFALSQIVSDIYQTIGDALNV